MPPSLALAVWFALLVLLLRFDPAKEPGTSLALWVPLIWIFIVGSRLPSQWLEGQLGTAAGAFEEGNPLDRAVFSILILLAIVILLSRSFNWGVFLTRNFFLVAFIAFALLSVLWSDFPFVAFKRWFRDLGNYLMVLVVLTDPHPIEALRTVFRRFCYLLIPLAVVLIKYFPMIGRYYSFWTGAVMYIGPTTGKNDLGALCLVSGLFFFWDTLVRWPERKERQTKRIIVLNLVFIAMTIWVLNLANSATSRVCLLLGCLIIAAVHSKLFKRRLAVLKVAIPTFFVLYLILAFGFDINADVAGAVGRDPTLTDRTLIWKTLLAIKTNPLLGTGYESFWLGPRVNTVWKQFGRLNEAHNGYLEMYLNLGLTGLFLLCGLLMASYRKIWKDLALNSSVASLSLALWTVILFYNVTEAAFKFHIMWAVFLMIAILVPVSEESRMGSAGAPKNGVATARFRNISFGIDKSPQAKLRPGDRAAMSGKIEPSRTTVDGDPRTRWYNSTKNGSSEAVTAKRPSVVTPHGHQKKGR
jgi:exopolysaccharide production protein ExoQ